MLAVMRSDCEASFFVFLRGGGLPSYTRYWRRCRYARRMNVYGSSAAWSTRFSACSAERAQIDEVQRPQDVARRDVVDVADRARVTRGSSEPAAVAHRRRPEHRNEQVRALRDAPARRTSGRSPRCPSGCRRRRRRRSGRSMPKPVFDDDPAQIVAGLVALALQHVVDDREHVVDVAEEIADGAAHELRRVRRRTPARPA